MRRRAYSGVGFCALVGAVSCWPKAPGHAIRPSIHHHHHHLAPSDLCGARAHLFDLILVRHSLFHRRGSATRGKPLGDTRLRKRWSDRWMRGEANGDNERVGRADNGGGRNGTEDNGGGDDGRVARGDNRGVGRADNGRGDNGGGAPSAGTACGGTRPGAGLLEAYRRRKVKTRREGENRVRSSMREPKGFRDTPEWFTGFFARDAS